MTQFSYFLLASILVFSLAGKIPAQAEKLLISEFVVTPTAGEFVEIYNPNAAPVVLSNYYLTDATYATGNVYYYQIVEGGGGGGTNFDFHARFPDGATIAPGEYQTVAIAGDSVFFGEYGVLPTYELYEDGTNFPNDVPDMREAFPGSINNQGTLTNTGEVVIVYHWDGMTDLVGDVDYVVYGDKVEAVDKTGVSIDGPDPGPDPTEYLPDTPIASQVAASPGQPHPGGESLQRIDLSEGAQVSTGGNGVSGADETSEDLDNTFISGEAPTPNAPHPSTAIGDDQNFIPTEYALHQNFPNPFNPTTTILYDLKQATDVTVKIYNMLGQEVRTLVSSRQEAGQKSVVWDGLNNAKARVTSGIYIYRIQAGDFVQARKMILMK